MFYRTMRRNVNEPEDALEAGVHREPDGVYMVPSVLGD